MPLSISLPTTKADGDASHTAGHNATNTAVNSTAAAVDALATIASTGSASNLSAGTVPTARLGSGSATSSTFLRGDQTWATPAGGGALAVKIRADSTGQSLSDTTETTIDFNTTVYNDDTGLYTVDLSADTITVNTTGIYLVSSSMRIGGGGTGERSSLLRVNGTTVTEFNIPVVSTPPCVLPTTSVQKLTAADVLDLRVYISGGASTIETGSVRFTWLTIASM